MTSKINNPYQESLLIEAQAAYYPEMVQVFIPKIPVARTPESARKASPGSTPTIDELEFEAMSQKFDGITGKNLLSLEIESNFERSLRRARKRIGDYILCNSFDMFVTFTIKDDRQNSARSRQKVLGWLKNQRKRNGKFRYIVVPEFHKDGKSLHFHALIGGYTGEIEQAISPKTGKPLQQKGSPVFQISGYTLGFTNVKLIGKKQEDRSKLSAYLKKYITKDMPFFENKQKYWVSKGLSLPSLEDNPEHWYKHVKPDWQIDLPNGTLMRYNLNKNALVDIFWEANK